LIIFFLGLFWDEALKKTKKTYKNVKTIRFMTEW